MNDRKPEEELEASKIKMDTTKDEQPTTKSRQHGAVGKGKGERERGEGKGEGKRAKGTCAEGESTHIFLD